MINDLWQIRHKISHLEIHQRIEDFKHKLNMKVGKQMSGFVVVAVHKNIDSATIHNISNSIKEYLDQYNIEQKMKEIL